MSKTTEHRGTRSLAGKIVLLVGGMALLSFLLAAILVASDVREQARFEAERELQVRLDAARRILAEDEGAFPDRITDWSRTLGVRLTLIAEDGRVMADGSVPRDQWSRMARHDDRPEFRAALASGSGEDLRYSDSTGVGYLYRARKIVTPSGPLILRAAVPLKDVDALLGQVRGKLALSLAMATACALALGLWGARRIARPLSELAAATAALEAGEPARFPSKGDAEVLRLSRSIRSSAERLRSALSDLERERATLRMVVESLPMGALLIDPKGKVRYANLALKDLIRDLPSRLEGAPFEGALKSPEVVRLIDRARAGEPGSATFAEQGAEGRYLRAEAILIRDHVLVAVLDLTESRLLEEARRSFVADAGHELQTPLTAVRAAAELMLDSPPEALLAEARPFLERILEQQERMSALVDDLLLLSRLEAGLPEEPEEELDLARLARMVAEDTQAHPNARGIEILCETPPAAPRRGQAEALRRALGNLADNSLRSVRERFGDEGGGRIVLRLDREGDAWILRVTDNGVGIPRNMRERVFDRFLRTDRSRTREGRGGWGLGLSIARRIAEGHGGHIDLTEAPGGGAIFSIVLPDPAVLS
jgi:two-component system phosphate regulon sensor histidine kinase PhoR